MLYGVRILHLRAPPPSVQFRRSEDESLPTVEEERRDLQLDLSEVTRQLTPGNLGHHFRRDLAILKSQDLLARWQRAKKASRGAGTSNFGPLTGSSAERHFHAPSKSLSIAPVPPEDWAELPERKKQWMPFSMMKPSSNVWSPLVGRGGPRGPTHAVYQEKLDRRGLGERKKQRLMWQQDVDTQRFSPERGY